MSVPNNLGFRHLGDIEKFPLMKRSRDEEETETSYADDPDARPVYLPKDERTLRLVAEAQILVEKLDGLHGRCRTEPLKKLQKICNILKGQQL